jgi:LacI family transcriptional regulator
MKDIAKDLGISKVTVSKVLNNHLDISPATRERVLQRVRELNYRPSLQARSLFTGQTLLAGLIVPDLVHAFFSEAAKSLSRILRQHGFGLLIADSNEDTELENEEIDQMLRRRVDMLFIASCQVDPQCLRRVVEDGVPLVLIDRSFEDFKANFVGTDDVMVGEMATEHLIRIGCRKIAYIGGKNVSTSEGRLEGYKNALKRNGIKVTSSYVLSREHGDESGDITGKAAMEDLLKLRSRPDAVFCYNDPAAIGAINAILAAGLRIPQDIAVIGAGNIRYAESLRVPLSSIDVSSTALGEQAGNLALELIAKPPRMRPKSIIIKPRLIVRESAARGVPPRKTAGKKTIHPKEG